MRHRLTRQQQQQHQQPRSYITPTAPTSTHTPTQANRSKQDETKYLHPTSLSLGKMGKKDFYKFPRPRAAAAGNVVL